MEQGANTNGRVRTGLFEIDLTAGELYKSGRKVFLPEQSFRALARLLKHPGQLVTREELKSSLFGDTHVGFDEGLNWAIRNLRLALGDSAGNRRFIETVPKRGYRFIASISVSSDAEPSQIRRVADTQFPAREPGPSEINNKSKEEVPQKARHGVRRVADMQFPAREPGPSEIVNKPKEEASQKVRHGVRRVADTQFPAPEPGPSEIDNKSKEEAPPKARHGVRYVSVAVTAGLLLAWILRSALPPPRVLEIRQLTRLGDLEYKIVTDGPRVYFGEGNWGADDQIRSVSIQGGDSLPLAQLQPGSEVQSVSPNGSELLLGKGLGDVRALWKVSLPSGSPEPLGMSPVSDAAWSPYGESIAFTNDTSLYLMKRDGSQLRKLATFTGFPTRPVWSPDGRRIRVTVTNFAGIWFVLGRKVEEVDVSHSTVRSVMIGPAGPHEDGSLAPLSPRSAAWIGSGGYFLFTAMEGGLNNIWVARENATWLRRGNHEPVRLTAGPLNFPFPIAGKDGKTIFAVGEQYHGQLMRYDRKSKKFAPFLEGLPADETAFSRDGGWLAYIAYPEHTLWRCRANGTGRLQLTFAPMQVGAPHWSPDGEFIAFHGESPGQAAKGYIISTNGGLAEPIFPESPNGQEMLSWSADGDQVMFVETASSAASRVRILDLKTGKVSDVPGSAGLTGAVWSPDGRYIAAEAVQNSMLELKLFDFQKGRWTTVAPWGVNVSWSANSQYLYFDSLNRYPRTAENNPGFFRARVHDGKVEKIFGVPDFNLAGFGIWVSVTPDGSPLVLKDNGTRDLYALDLDLP